jgi:glycosyltransferase involved in cell wall biosynthesis
MRICHFTNTFLPHVGGVARAVQTLLEDQRRARHRVLVVAPEFADGPAPRSVERSVARIPALTGFNATDFSVRLPFAAMLSERLAKFRADIVHAHHPFLLGDTALREAASRQVPVVFTHHTLYERYTHYLPIESETLGDFAAEVATRFANRCAAVVAPSESVRDLILSRGVTVPVHAIPTGIDTALLATGRGARARKRFRLPADAPVVGHLGRLAAEKNLSYLAQAIGLALQQTPAARALVVGDGPARADMEKTFADLGVAERVVFAGKLSGAPLRDACAAMDLFAFSSTSETQGLVLAEAMACGSPVVALDASGVREVLRDHQNGRLLPEDSPPDLFARTLAQTLRQPDLLARWSEAARATAAELDRAKTSARLLALYQQLIAERRAADSGDNAFLKTVKPIVERIATEGRIIADKAGALLDASTGSAPSTNEPTAA